MARTQHWFTAVQAAKKTPKTAEREGVLFTAVQAAKKKASGVVRVYKTFTAVQAAKKSERALLSPENEVHCRTGS